jgi:P27 family predicted phage terminase small subunit
MRGRRPKPSRIKALTGNPGKRPLNAHEPRPAPALPECPPELSHAGRQEWARLSAELSKLNLITHLDRGALATYCAAYGFWAEALQQIQKYGTMVKSPTGYPTDPVALPCHCKQAGGDHDARCIRVRLYTRKPQPDIGAAPRSASASRSHHG